MAMAEIESFLLKFKTLWKSGRDATLTMETHAGQASVLLRVGLGQAPKQYPNFPSPGKNRNGPARQRRRAKRELARLNAVEAGEAGKEAAVAGEVAQARQEAGIAGEAAKASENAGQTDKSLVNDEVCNDSIYNDQNHPVEKEKVEDDKTSEKLWKFVGKFKNPKTKSWTIVDPEKDCKLSWEMIKDRDRNNDIEEIGEASSYFENHIEFWGTWKVKGSREEFLQNVKNWPKGVEILELKPG
jgi:hypothetical protein